MSRFVSGRWGALVDLVEGPQRTREDGVPDFHPLSAGEIRMLLGIYVVALAGREADEAAGDRTWMQVVTGIPVRLGRAVPGILSTGSPHGSFVNDVSFLVNSLFHDECESFHLPALADELASLLANDRPNFGTLSPALAARLGRPDLAGSRVRYVRGADPRGEYAAVVRPDADGKDWITPERDTKLPLGPLGIVPETDPT